MRTFRLGLRGPLGCGYSGVGWGGGWGVAGGRAGAFECIGCGLIVCGCILRCVGCG